MPTNGSTVHGDVSRIPVAFLILGWENNRNALVNFIRNAKTGISLVTDARQPQVYSSLDWLWNEVYDARQRGVKFREITDITIDNLANCTRNMERVNELRHLGGIGVVFAHSDTEAITMVPSSAPGDFNRVRFVQSNSESVVGHKKLMFEALWNRALPAQRRIYYLKSITRLRAPLRARNEIIDRVYLCIACKQTFIYASEVEDHKTNEGHGNFRNFRIV